MFHREQIIALVEVYTIIYSGSGNDSFHTATHFQQRAVHLTMLGYITMRRSSAMQHHGTIISIISIVEHNAPMRISYFYTFVAIGFNLKSFIFTVMLIGKAHHDAKLIAVDPHSVNRYYRRSSGIIHNHSVVDNRGIGEPRELIEIRLMCSFGSSCQTSCRNKYNI